MKESDVSAPGRQVVKEAQCLVHDVVASNAAVDSAVVNNAVAVDNVVAGNVVVNNVEEGHRSNDVDLLHSLIWGIE